MILCVTPNPALDRTLVVSDFSAGAVYRAEDVSVVAGGKGLNVARALQIFGGKAICAGFIGGRSGELLTSLAANEGLEGVWTQVAGDTRSCLSIADPKNGETTVINEAGLPVSADDWENLKRDVLAAAENIKYVSINGSIPPESPEKSFIGFIHALQADGHEVWVDTHGAALQTAIRAKPTAIKINHLEAETVVDTKIHDVQSAADAAASIQRRGIETVIITMGKNGAVLAHKKEFYHASAPRIEAMSTVGSGDTFFAGLMNALSQNVGYAEALRQATAAGAANALTIGAGYFKLDDFHRLLLETTVV